MKLKDISTHRNLPKNKRADFISFFIFLYLHFSSFFFEQNSVIFFNYKEAVPKKRILVLIERDDSIFDKLVALNIYVYYILFFKVKYPAVNQILCFFENEKN